jgi:aconitate hydratase
MLEVLSGAGALTDLIATGARLIEPDARVMTGELYPPPVTGGLSARTHDLEPGSTAPKPVAIASAEALAYAVATGEMGDPRSFKRPVRVTIPRALPTDDVLVVRDRKGAAGDTSKKASIVPAPPTPWKGGQTLDLVEGTAHLLNGKGAPPSPNGVAVVCSTLDEVRELAARATEIAERVRAIVAPFIPSSSVALFSGLGIAALRVDAAGAKGLKGQRTIALPETSKWSEKGPTVVTLGTQKVPLTWLALGSERAWASAGTARPTASRSKP